MNSTSTNTLVETSTADNLILHGYFAPVEGDTALLHIHGFEGNFYENHFTHVQADTLAKHNIPFLSANTRGNGKDTNFNTTDGQEKRIGAYFEVLSEAYLDIDAWVEFLMSKGYSKIVLQGHSLGTHKVIRYLFEGKHKDKISKLILLAPFDKTGYVEKKTNGEWTEYLRTAEQKVSEGKGEEIIPENFEDTLTSYQTYVSWYEGSDYSHVFNFFDKSYEFPILNKITIPTKIIVGTKDPYFHPSNPDSPQEAMDILLKNIPNSDGELIENSVHSFAPHEQVMADEVIKFIDSNA